MTDQFLPAKERNSMEK